MSFGERLREARIASGMNQKDLGMLVGVTGNSISNYEKGTSSPNDGTLQRLFDALNVDPNFLFQDSFISTNKASAVVQRPVEDEKRLINYFRILSAQDRAAILRFAALAAGESIEPPEQEFGEEARRAAESLVRQSDLQEGIREVAK